MTADDSIEPDSPPTSPYAPAASAMSSTPAAQPIQPVASGNGQKSAGVLRKIALTTWEGVWYVLSCIPFGMGYFSKVPVKKAMHDFGLVEMTSAERFWYVVMCIPFGAGYFAKIPVAKALSELPQYRADRQASLGTLG